MRTARTMITPGWIGAWPRRTRICLRFFKQVIGFRHAHPALRRKSFFDHRDIRGAGTADITFHGLQPFAPDYSDGSRCLAFMFVRAERDQNRTMIFMSP